MPARKFNSILFRSLMKPIPDRRKGFGDCCTSCTCGKPTVDLRSSRQVSDVLNLPKIRRSFTASTNHAHQAQAHDSGLVDDAQQYFMNHEPQTCMDGGSQLDDDLIVFLKASVSRKSLKGPLAAACLHSLVKIMSESKEYRARHKLARSGVGSCIRDWLMEKRTNPRTTDISILKAMIRLLILEGKENYIWRLVLESQGDLPQPSEDGTAFQCLVAVSLIETKALDMTGSLEDALKVALKVAKHHHMLSQQGQHNILPSVLSFLELQLSSPMPQSDTPRREKDHAPVFGLPTSRYPQTSDEAWKAAFDLVLSYDTHVPKEERSARMWMMHPRHPNWMPMFRLLGRALIATDHELLEEPFVQGFLSRIEGYQLMFEHAGYLEEVTWVKQKVEDVRARVGERRECHDSTITGIRTEAPTRSIAVMGGPVPELMRSCTSPGPGDYSGPSRDTLYASIASTESKDMLASACTELDVLLRDEDNGDDKTENPELAFRNALARGIMTRSFAMKCLYSMGKYTENRCIEKASADQTGVLSRRTGTGQLALNWLYIRDGWKAASITESDAGFVEVLVRLLVMDDREDMVWGWILDSQTPPGSSQSAAAPLTGRGLVAWALVKAKSLYSPGNYDDATAVLLRAHESRLPGFQSLYKAVISHLMLPTPEHPVLGNDLDHDRDFPMPVRERHTDPAAWNAVYGLVPELLPEWRVSQCLMMLRHPVKPDAMPALKMLQGMEMDEELVFEARRLLPVSVLSERLLSAVDLLRKMGHVEEADWMVTNVSRILLHDTSDNHGLGIAALESELSNGTMAKSEVTHYLDEFVVSLADMSAEQARSTTEQTGAADLALRWLKMNSASITQADPKLVQAVMKLLLLADREEHIWSFLALPEPKTNPQHDKPNNRHQQPHSHWKASLLTTLAASKSRDTNDATATLDAAVAVALRANDLNPELAIPVNLYIAQQLCTPMPLRASTTSPTAAVAFAPTHPTLVPRYPATRDRFWTAAYNLVLPTLPQHTHAVLNARMPLLHPRRPDPYPALEYLRTMARRPGVHRYMSFGGVDFCAFAEATAMLLVERGDFAGAAWVRETVGEIEGRVVEVGEVGGFDGGEERVENGERGGRARREGMERKTSEGKRRRGRGVKHVILVRTGLLECAAARSAGVDKTDSVDVNSGESTVREIQDRQDEAATKAKKRQADRAQSLVGNVEEVEDERASEEAKGKREKDEKRRERLAQAWQRFVGSNGAGGEEGG